MILDSIYNGTFRPGEIGAMDREEYRQAMREVGLFQSQLTESIDKEDCLLLEELILPVPAVFSMDFPPGFY